MGGALCIQGYVGVWGIRTDLASAVCKVKFDIASMVSATLTERIGLKVQSHLLFTQLLRLLDRPQRSCGNVMFIHLSVILFMEGGGISVQGGLCLGGLCPGRFLSGRPPPLYGYVRAVRILLECILV